MLADRGTDLFRLVALWISLVVIVNHVLDDLIIYVCAYTYTNTNGRKLFHVLDYCI